MKKQGRVFKLLFVIFGVVGIALMIGGALWTVTSARFRSSAAEVTGVISEIISYRDSDDDIHHEVYVNYTYNNKTYSNIRISEYSSGMYEGKEIALYVDPGQPEKVSTGTVLGGVILLGMGAVFLLTAVIPAVYSAKKSSARRKLLAEGRCIYATVESISQNMSYAVNGQHPYVIYCTYRDEYKDVTYRFRSENIWTNPEYAVSVGSEIRVYVKDGDYSRYYVDAESILSKKVIDYT